MNTAFLFSGQGAQTVGMGKELLEKYTSSKAVFDKANDVLGYDIKKIIFEGPEENLTNSQNCQPAIFTVSVAYLRAFEESIKNRPIIPAFLAGLSLGEWTALYVANVVSFEDTLRILAARGAFMQEACEANPGAMLSVIGLPYEIVSKLAEETSCFVANVNSPEQVVLSGSRDSIDKAINLAKQYGAKKVVMLAVSGAYHSPLMKMAALKFEKFIENITFSAPKIPVISNVTALPHSSNPSEIKKTMIAQITSSVQWLDSIKYIASKGISTFYEFGPGKVLTGLVKRIVDGANLYNNPLGI